MTVRDIEARLADAGIDSAHSEAMLLLSRYSGKSYASLLAEPNLSVDSAELESVVRRRCERYPLQYLLGTWEFCGYEFKVTPDTLIPRPDTEILAEKAASFLPKGGKILDLCTGTGCVLAAALKLSGNRRGVAVDLFPAVCEVARENFAALSLDCTVLAGDATTDLFPAGEQFDVITANPPYVTADEMTSLEPELSYEPRTALTDEGDGLSILRKIIELYSRHLTENGVMLLEHGADQSAAVVAIGETNGLTAEVLRDYGGHDRAVLLRRK